uniref:HTH CENPB-type domain-containing protein n=1 Tax=Ditylenchus dipsaci TaxID=166011 RepID=A0A915CKE7_9BILA
MAYEGDVSSWYPIDTSQRKRKVDLATKRAIIEGFSKGKGYKVLSEEFGIKKASVQNIIQNKTAILGAIDGGTEAKRARLKAGRHENLERALGQWLKQTRAQNVPVGEAQRALRLVRQYVEKNFANPQLLRQSDALDEAFWQDGQKKGSRALSVISSSR